MRFPIVTLLLVLGTSAAYGLEMAYGGYPVCEAFGLVPARFSQTGNLTEVFAAMLLHDPAAVSHLAFNMAFLAFLGGLVEMTIGSLSFAALYAGAGLAGGLLHVLVDPSTSTPMVGASGAVFGVLAVAAAIRPRLISFALPFVGFEIWRAFGAEEGVSFGAHLGGFAAGVVFAGILRLVDRDALEVA